MLNVAFCDDDSHFLNEVLPITKKIFNTFKINVSIDLVVTVEESTDTPITSLIDSNIGIDKEAKFQINKKDNCSFKVTLNPKDNYSVSEHFSDDFQNGAINKYKIVIVDNEICIQKEK